MEDYLPGTASLIPYVDKRLLVVLRDQRTLIGILRSIDQFANLVLHRTIERIHVGTQYGDIPRGIFLVRGENVVLLGELDEEKDGNLEEVSVDVILELQQEQIKQRQEEQERRLRVLKERGLHFHTEQCNEEFL